MGNQQSKGPSRSALRVGGIVLECTLAVFVISLVYLRSVQKVDGAPRLAPAAAASLKPVGGTVCITDNVSGDVLSFSNPGGAYTFRHCKTGLTLTGTGAVTTPSGNVVLTASTPTQKVSATFLPGQGTGHAVINYSTAPGMFQTFTLNQTVPHAPCGTCAVATLRRTDYHLQ